MRRGPRLYAIDVALSGFSDGAILYAVRELGRRAGASSAEISRWRVEFGERNVSLFPNPDSLARVEFPFDRSKAPRFDELWQRPAERYEGYVVPFEEKEARGPLFDCSETAVVRVRGDILAATLWLLSRREEYDHVTLDEHGRSLGLHSAAYRDGYLDRPIVDEYGVGLGRSFQHLLPSWAPVLHQLRVKLSHDMDQVGVPRHWRTTLGHLYPRRLPWLFVRDVYSAIGIGPPAYLQAAYDLATTSQCGRFHSAFYWKASARKTDWDTGYDINHPAVRRTIEDLTARGCEMGLHPAYDTFGSAQRLDEELTKLRQIVGDGPIGGRTHYLLWNPDTWLAWEKAGLAYDSTLGYHDQIGFRTGTSIPYHPWSLKQDRELALLEIPLIVMDCTPIAYMKLGSAETLVRIGKLARTCRDVGGVFTLLWHNYATLETQYASLYPQILNILEEHTSYDFNEDLCPWPVPRRTR